jgi:hypothetical protein
MALNFGTRITSHRALSSGPAPDDELDVDELESLEPLNGDESPSLSVRSLLDSSDTLASLL